MGKLVAILAKMCLFVVNYMSLFHIHTIILFSASYIFLVLTLIQCISYQEGFFKKLTVILTSTTVTNLVRPTIVYPYLTKIR